MATRQVSITLDEDLVAFLDQCGGNRSAAVAAALREWRDREWLRGLERAYAALGEMGATPPMPDALLAAQEAAELSALSP